MLHIETEHRITIARSISSVIILASVLLFNKTDNVLIDLLLYAIPYLIIGYDVIFKAFRNIIKGEVFDECFLMTLATVGAFAIGEYPEAVAVMLFYQIGEMLQDIAVDKSKESIESLLELKPETARVIRNGIETEIAPEDVGIGETVLVLPGERIPLDGVIIEGTGTVNTSALTGESLPREVTVGDTVMNGCINLVSAIKLRVTALYSDSTVARIIELAEEATERKAAAESFIRRFAKYYTPIVVVSALLLAIVPPLILQSGLTEWIERALIFLVVSCPCALVISVPLSFFSGIGAAARRGILVKGAIALEDLAKADRFIFDKTGTLTEGVFSVKSIVPYDISEHELIEAAAHVESYSNHPIAKSIVSYYNGAIDKTRVVEVNELAGMGLSGVFDGKKVLAGNKKLVSLPDDAGSIVSDGTVVHISIDGRYVGHIVIADSIKDGAHEAIARLKSDGVGTVMLTGDNEATATSVSSVLGIDKAYSSLLPSDKVERVKHYVSSSNGKVAFVGDGINDAPALATASVGIAFGRGSDAAIDSADIVVMSSSPAKIVEAFKIARETMKIVKQNVAFSLIVKLVILITGALGISGMWLAVFADVGVTIIAVLSATRMLDIKK